MTHAAPSMTRLAEILNGAATTQQELHQYLSPDAKQRFHVTEGVEGRLRDLLLQAVERDARWQETLASISRPWRDELVQIEAAGRSQILGHAAHAQETKCHCWRAARESYYAAVDRWADDREAVTEFGALWDSLVLLSETHRPQQQEDIAANIAAAVSDTIEEQIASAMRDAAFLGRKRVR